MRPLPTPFCPELHRTVRLGLTFRTDHWSASPFEAVACIPDYVLLKEIGQGSYGSVWLARSITGLYRAVKIVYRSLFEDDAPYEREFRGLKEFAAVSGNTGALLSVLHVGRNEAAGFFYYIMELADDIATGRQIDPVGYVPKTLDQVRRRVVRLPAGAALELGVELATALAALHDQGLVHRDVKPSNIIFVGNVPKFADIGLVRPAGLDEDCPSLVGNTAYMPSELPGDFSADVFGLGKILYEFCTGRRHREFPALPTDLADLPDRKALLELNGLVLQACAARPSRRFADARALLEAMVRLQAEWSARRRRQPAGHPLVRWMAAPGSRLATLVGWLASRAAVLRAQREA